MKQIPMKDSTLIILAAATLAATTTSNTFDLALGANMVFGQFNPTGGGAAMQLVAPVTSYNANTSTATISGSPTGGTFALSVTNSGGVSTTTALAYNASAATVQAALVALANVGAGNATVTLSGSTYTIVYANSLGPTYTTANGALLTGGTTPAAATVNDTYSLQVFTSPDGVNWTAASRVATVAGDAILPTGDTMQIDFAASVRYVQLVVTITGTNPSIVLGDCYLSPMVNKFGF